MIQLESRRQHDDIRCRTGAIAALISEPCACGRTFRRMSRVKGRVDDMPAVWAEVGDDDGTGSEDLRRLQARVETGLLQELTGRVRVELVPRCAVPRSEGKAVRIVDLRGNRVS